MTSCKFPASVSKIGYTTVLVIVLKKNPFPRINAPITNNVYTKTLITSSSGTDQNAFNATAIPAVPPTSNLLGITKNATANAIQAFPKIITKISMKIFFNFLFTFFRFCVKIKKSL